jgi:hypothetical protein
LVAAKHFAGGVFSARSKAVKRASLTIGAVESSINGSD